MVFCPVYTVNTKDTPPGLGTQGNQDLQEKKKEKIAWFWWLLGRRSDHEMDREGKSKLKKKSENKV